MRSETTWRWAGRARYDKPRVPASRVSPSGPPFRTDRRDLTEKAASEYAMNLLKYGVVSLFVGCATSLPEEPYLWRDDARPVGVHRADIARAEGRVIEYLVASGTLEPVEVSCGRSARAFQVVTIETPAVYEVRLVLRPGLCAQAPESATLPPVPPTIERSMASAVRKSDFRIIRVRRPGDDAVPMVFPSSELPPPGGTTTKDAARGVGEAVKDCALYYSTWRQWTTLW